MEKTGLQCQTKTFEQHQVTHLILLLIEILSSIETIIDSLEMEILLQLLHQEIIQTLLDMNEVILILIMYIGLIQDGMEQIGICGNELLFLI